MSAISNVTIRIATEADREAITHNLRKFFFTDEPLSHSLQLTKDSPENEDFERFCFAAFGKGVDLVAESGGKLVGVCLNVIMERGMDEKELPAIKCKKFEKIYRFIRFFEKSMDVFSKYPQVDKILNLAILSIDASMRGQGLGKKFVIRTKELAKEIKAGVCIVECSSAYTMAAAKSVGFEEIYSLDYEDYKVNGEVVFKPAPPHNKSLKIVAVKL